MKKTVFPRFNQKNITSNKKNYQHVIFLINKQWEKWNNMLVEEVNGDIDFHIQKVLLGIDFVLRLYWKKIVFSSTHIYVWNVICWIFSPSNCIVLLFGGVSYILTIFYYTFIVFSMSTFIVIISFKTVSFNFLPLVFPKTEQCLCSLYK